MNLTIHNQWALGDTICLSALVRDIHLAYPGQHQLSMSGHYQSYWRHCPYATIANGATKGRIFKPQYLEGIKSAGRGLKYHFLSWFHEDFRRQTGIRVPVTKPHGEIWLPPEATNKSPYPFRYWLINAGCKADMTVKQWRVTEWQQTVDLLAKLGIKCVQAGADFHKHYHTRLRNVESAVGKTDDIQDFFRLIYHAEGVICGITAAMHAAAAFQKPCVVIAGGREEPWWEAYTNCYAPTSWGAACEPVKVEHTFLHTVGLLDCCQDKGCWKDRTVPLDATDLSNVRRKRQMCKYPLKIAGQDLPKCMDMIKTDHVVEAVMNYYAKGVIPPIGEPTRKYSLPLEQPTPPGMVMVVPGAYELVDPDGKVVGWSHIHPGEDFVEKFDVTGKGAPPVRITSHTIDHSTCPPTERMTMMFPKEFLPREPEDPAHAVLDHPFIGGKFTVCILGHGNHKDLMERCLGSILTHSPKHRLDIRVALNQPSKALLDYVAGFDKDTITQIYVDQGDRKKYPAMREMFWDDCCPITTKYVVWFDDDSHAIDHKWLAKLGDVIVANHPQGCRLYGTKFVHDLMKYKREGFNPEKWFKEGGWWKNVWLHMAEGRRTAPNGHQIVFATGGFWALATDVIRMANIPDPRLIHNGGDITIGEQVHQMGFKVCDFARGKKPVCWSDASPRGTSHKGPAPKEFPWSKYQ